MSDNWDDVEVWKKVKGSNQVRQRSIGDAIFLDVKTEGEVLRIQISADSKWDDDIIDAPANENPVHFEDFKFGSEFYPGETVPPPLPGDSIPPPPPEYVMKVKTRLAGGGSSQWMNLPSENFGLVPDVVAVAIGYPGMPNDKSYMPSLQPNQYIANAEIGLEATGAPMPPATWSHVQISCETALSTG